MGMSYSQMARPGTTSNLIVDSDLDFKTGNYDVSAANFIGGDAEINNLNAKYIFADWLFLTNNHITITPSNTEVMEGLQVSSSLPAINILNEVPIYTYKGSLNITTHGSGVTLITIIYWFRNQNSVSINVSAPAETKIVYQIPDNIASLMIKGTHGGIYSVDVGFISNYPTPLQA